MNEEHGGKEDENWLIFNVSILLLSHLEADHEDDRLQVRFGFCYYKSRTGETGRDAMLRKFYSANN